MFFYYVVCFFPDVLLLDSSCFVAIVRIRSTTRGSSSPVRLLHGLVLLPSGISGKMTVTLDLTTVFAMLVLSMLSLCRATHHLFIKPPQIAMLASNLFTHPSKLLFGYIAVLLRPSYSIASCRCSCKLFHLWDMDILGYHNISYLINASIYLVKGGRLGLLPGVVSVIPVLCSLNFVFLTRSGF